MRISPEWTPEERLDVLASLCQKLMNLVTAADNPEAYRCAYLGYEVAWGSAAFLEQHHRDQLARLAGVQPARQS